MADRDIINYFAETAFRNIKQKFGIRKTDRRQHTYVIGKTGTGKTTLLKNMALQDIHNGEGLAIVDPHGEFIEEVLENIPQSRVDDVVYFNPADMDHPIGFNILEVPDPKYKHLVSSGLMGVFTKIWANVWSARMEYILNNCILALLDTPGSTLLGVNRMLLDKDYRQKVINNIEDPVVKSFWVNEFEGWQDKYRSEAIAPIQNKVGQFLNVSLIRNIVGQEDSTINIPDIMNKKKIFLINVSKGRIGEDNSALLGAILITQIQLHAMERVRIPEEERQDFYLYVDEFQNFVTDAFANVLSEARKYRLDLILTHQYVGQLVTESSTKVRDAIFGNVGTLMAFRVGAADAEFLEKEFTPEFEARDLVDIPNYHVYLRLMVDGITKRPFSAATLPPIEFTVPMATKDAIIASSRRQYAAPREEVEKKIASWSGVFDEDAAAIELYDAICTECSKETKVPFKPEKGRPIYCEICLKKGGKKVRSYPRREAEETAALAAMGIEFEGKPETKAPRPRPTRPARGPRVQKAPSARRAPRPKAMSLDELKKQPSKMGEKAKKTANVEELRKVLDEALGDSEK